MKKKKFWQCKLQYVTFLIKFWKGLREHVHVRKCTPYLPCLLACFDALIEVLHSALLHLSDGLLVGRAV